MENYSLTKRMEEWLARVYTTAAANHRSVANNCHLWALGSQTNREATYFEQAADEHREFARILEAMAKELEMEDE